MQILNLTQHVATPDQLTAGVKDMPAEMAVDVKTLLTFDVLPSIVDIERRAMDIADIVRSSGFNAVMIGGAPFFMPALERSLSAIVKVGYAFSQRESIDQQQADGSIKKVAVFKHAGFIWIN